MLGSLPETARARRDCYQDTKDAASPDGARMGEEGRVKFYLNFSHLAPYCRGVQVIEALMLKLFAVVILKWCHNKHLIIGTMTSKI